MVHKIITSILILFTFSGVTFAQNAEQRYINRYKAIALQQEREYGIPAPITLAQGIVESGCGESGLAKYGNNHFGIKVYPGWKGVEYLAQDDEPGKSHFCRYNSAEESYIDHSRFFHRFKKRYGFLFAYHRCDYVRWAIGLKKAGYASSPTYALSIIKTIERNQLYNINGGKKLQWSYVSMSQTSRRTPKQKIVYKGERQTVLEEGEDIPEDNTIVAMQLETENDQEAFCKKHYVLRTEINAVRCKTLAVGESVYSVVSSYGIPLPKLLYYNEITDPNNFKEGDVVYLEKKQKNYKGYERNHHADAGETLYSISQQYGIRISSLCKLNPHISIDATLDAGEPVKLQN